MEACVGYFAMYGILADAWYIWQGIAYWAIELILVPYHRDDDMDPVDASCSDTLAGEDCHEGGLERFLS